jgi:lysophospholipase L1-like esterase
MRANHHWNRGVLILTAIAALAVAGSAEAKRVACVGASNTYGYGLADRQMECYPSQLAEILKAFDPTWEVGNFGLNGACVLQKGSLPYIRQGAFRQAQAYNPDVVVIQLGGNDSVAANWVYRNDFLADFLVLIDSFVQLPSQPRIYICSSPPFYSNPYGIDNNIVQGQIGPLMAQLTTHRDVQMIDLYTPMMDSRDLFQSDGIHFTVAGARLAAEVVAAMVLGVAGTPDFTSDEKVDIDDLVLLIEHWGEEEPSLDIAPPPVGDGIVDANDLKVFMEYWGREVRDPALVAHWKLNEIDGLTAADSAGANDGALVGDPIWKPTEGKVGGALQLDGVDDCITTEFVRDPSEGPFSVFAWIKAGTPRQVILSQAGGANWLAADAADGSLTAEISGGGRTGKPLKSTGMVTDSTWHRVGFVWDGSNRILYTDDMEVARDSQSSLAASRGGLYIGAGSTLAPATFWAGLIDDVRIYRRAVQPISR